MKKFALIALLSILSTSAFASGTISAQVSEANTKKEHFAVGLNIYEPVVGPLVYQSYTGTGDNHKYGGEWLTTKHQLDLAISKVTVSPGFGVNYTTYDKIWDNEVFLKVGYKLW
jgi:hypothetical protein